MLFLLKIQQSLLSSKQQLYSRDVFESMLPQTSAGPSLSDNHSQPLPDGSTSNQPVRTNFQPAHMPLHDAGVDHAVDEGRAAIQSSLSGC